MTKRKVKAVKIDSGYLNALVPANMRGRMTNYSAEMISGAQLMSEPILQASYIHNGIFRTICDVPAEEMTRAGFELDGMSEDEEEKIQSRLEELNAMKKFSEAIKWRNAFGGALILLGINDGGSLEDEVDETNVSSIEFMRVYDRFECRPSTRFGIDSEKFGEVELWEIYPRDGQTTSFKAHSSRVLVFDGQSVPNIVRHSNDGWGAPVIQSCFKQVIRLDTAYKLSIDLLAKMQQAVHKIPDLSTQLETTEGESLVTKRVAIVDHVRGIYNTVIIDADEEYEIKSLTITGVKDIVNTHAEAVSGVSRIPIFLLLGKTEGGLNSNGESSKEGWYTQVGAWQSEQLHKPLDRLVSLVKLGISEGSDDGGSYTLKFCPLYTPSDKDKAEIELKKEQAKKAKADTLVALMGAGVMDETEARDQVRDEYDLVGDAPEPIEEPAEPIVLNPGQKIVDPIPGQNNPKPPVGTK